MSASVQPTETLTRGQRARVVLASLVGNFGEWYDFSSYGVVAVVLSKTFFPPGNEALGLLATYVVFALTYIARPLGGLVCGWIGDKFGRRASLMITILVMALATGLVGVLPTYSAAGVVGPLLLLLLRLLQGLGAGGEYGSAIGFLYEHSPSSSRGRTISFVVGSTFLGTLAGVAFASLLTLLLGNGAFDSWGWRILFLAALPLGLIGAYIRRNVAETPAFKAISEEESQAEHTPIKDAFRTQKLAMLIFFIALAIYPLATTTVSSFFTTFLRNTAGLSSGSAYQLTLITDATLIIVALLVGWLCDRIGAWRTLLTGTIAASVLALPVFFLAANGSWMAVLGAIVLGFFTGLLAVPNALLIAQLFPPEVRITAGSFAYNVTVVVFGSTGPLVGVALNNATGSSYSFGLYLAIVAVISLIGTILGRRVISRNHEPLNPKVASIMTVVARPVRKAES